jgi:transcriptional regulator with XRE-family HTH domain
MPHQTQTAGEPASRHPAADGENARQERSGHALVIANDAACGHDTRPFAVRLDELRRTHNLTFRALEARLRACAKPGERGMTNSHLAALTTGRNRPTPQVVELIARGFDLPPQSFIEWRMWQVQELFDPERSDGFQAAVAELIAFLDTSPDVRELDKVEALGSRRNVFALRRLG